MGDSNAEWGELAQHDDELAEAYDSLGPLPESGENPILDAFVTRKHITLNSLVRLGARLAGPDVLAFGFPGGIKFRNIVTDKRWSYAGSEFKRLKIVRHGTEPSSTVIVAEGETDAARLTDHYDADVAVLPAGADPRPHTQAYVAQLSEYELVLLGQDDDVAGDAGAAILAHELPQSVRFAPPNGDWCDSHELPPLPSSSELPVSVEMKLLVPAGELLSLEPPPMISWFEHGLLPVAGSLILHGWAKSFKSFLALDLLSALSQGQDWAGFEPTEEPCRVAILQYEIPWAYYQQRIQLLSAAAREPALFDSNFHTFTPLRRPQFVAGNVGQEDIILKALETNDIQAFLLDPVRRATGVADLDKEKEVRPLLHFFERVQDLGVTVITCHHDNKTFARQGGGNPLGMTGSGSFSGDFDTIVSISLPKGKTIEDPERNMHFLMRNAPSVGARGMQMGDDGHIVYSLSQYGDGLEGDESGPAI
jgi:5S rRNA maturation endonuclease (ribonuclease M5)